MNFRYPVFLDVSGKKCVVAGEGGEIEGKVRALAAAGAAVVYVNPRATEGIAELARSGKVAWERREVRAEDLAGCFLAIADVEENASLFRAAEERNVLFNAVDDPENCRFSFGSIHRQGDLTIAISTNGRAPALAVRLRERFEREIGAEYGELLELMKQVRGEIAARVPEFGARRALWYRIVDSDILELLREGKREAAVERLRALIAEAVNNTSPTDTSGDSGDR